MTNTALTQIELTGALRQDAAGLAFEMIDALGVEGALRFYAEHKANATAIMGLMDAMDDHDMSFDVLPR